MKALALFGLLLALPTFSASFERPFLVTSEVPHEVTVLEHGASAMMERLSLIERAKHSIDVEYFIYNKDRAGRLLTQALLRRAKQGVRVRMLLDAFSTKGEIDPHTAKLLTDNGIEVKFYNPTPIIRVRKYMVRNHRKLLQIDGADAILGGRNVADEYYDLNSEFSFIDRDVLVKGPITAEINQSFERYWEHSFSQFADTTPGEIIRRRFEKNRAKAQDFITESDEDRRSLEILTKQAKLWEPNKITGTCRKITFGTSMPGWGEESKSGEHLGSFLNQLISSVPEKGKGAGRVLIDSAYFIIDPKFREVLRSLRRSGTQVDIITNSIHSHDVIVMTPATNVSIRRLSKKGINFWYFKGERPEGYNIDADFKTKKWASHVKSMIINDDTFMVGSYNFDPRAHHLNGELAIICEDSPELTKGLGDYFDNELAASDKVSSIQEFREKRFKNVNAWGKLKYILAWPLSQMLRPLL